MRELLHQLIDEIQVVVEQLDEAYALLGHYYARTDLERRDVILAYHLNAIYGLFENLFSRIALQFEGLDKKTTNWHAALLRSMMEEIPNLRPAVISNRGYQSLSELLRFRHLFRNAYILQFDLELMQKAIEAAFYLKNVYPVEVARFLNFLTELADTVD